MKSPFKLFYDGDQDIDLAGSFHHALYNIWFKADAQNKVKLQKGFPDFFSENDLTLFNGKSEPITELVVLVEHTIGTNNTAVYVNDTIRSIEKNGNEILSMDIKPIQLNHYLVTITYKNFNHGNTKD